MLILTFIMVVSIMVQVTITGPGMVTIITPDQLLSDIMSIGTPIRVGVFPSGFLMVG